MPACVVVAACDAVAAVDDGVVVAAFRTAQHYRYLCYHCGYHRTGEGRCPKLKEFKKVLLLMNSFWK